MARWVLAESDDFDVVRFGNDARTLRLDPATSLVLPERDLDWPGLGWSNPVFAFSAPTASDLGIEAPVSTGVAAPTDFGAPSAAGGGTQSANSLRGITPTYTFVNTAGVAQATIDLLTGVANEAFRLWGNVLAGTANISVQITIADTPEGRANGGWGAGFSVGSSGGFSVAVGAPAYELALGTNTGGSNDIVISIDPDYLANELFLDSTPTTRNDIPSNRTDGLSVFLHEIGHALGFIGYYNESNNTFASNFKTIYDLRLAIAGGDVSFLGPNVQALMGGSIPLTDMNYAHYGNTNAFPGTSSDPLTGLMNGVVFYRGYGYTIGDLDLAVLADTGLGTIRNDILNVAVLTHMRGGPGNDTITGSGLNNFLWGDEDNDIIYGGSGNDTIDGGTGINQLFGEAGNDRLTIMGEGSSVDGGTETDTLVVTAGVVAPTGGPTLAALAGIEAIELVGGIVLTLTGSQVEAGLAINTTLSGFGNITVNMSTNVPLLMTSMAVQSGSSINITVFGTSGVDVVKASLTAVNTINGGDGTDQIRGGALVDTINGGNDGDKIFGFSGADVLTGGAGSDQFRYVFAADSGLGTAADRITDFVVGQDLFNFVLIDADSGTPDDQAFGFIGTGAFTNTGVGQIRFQNSGGDLLVQVDVDGNGTADMEVVLQGLAGQTLTSADFML